MGPHNHEIKTRNKLCIIMDEQVQLAREQATALFESCSGAILQ